MKYQRVLCTNKLTEEMKSKLHIVSFDKRRSCKGNVYFVSFASDADMKLADGIAKRLRNIALKPIQLFSSDTQPEHQINVCSNQESLLSSSPTTLSFLSNFHSTFITPQPSPLQQADETLEERARRILGTRIAIHENSQSIPTLKPSNCVSSDVDVNSRNNYIIHYEKDKKQLTDNVKSSLKTMEMARHFADHLCQLYSKISRF